MSTSYLNIIFGRTDESFMTKMDLSIQMRVIYNVKRFYATCMKFGDKFLTFLTKLVVKAKASICSIYNQRKSIFMLW